VIASGWKALESLTYFLPNQCELPRHGVERTLARADAFHAVSDVTPELCFNLW
jgi:hypothetical protein